MHKIIFRQNIQGISEQMNYELFNILHLLMRHFLTFK